MTTLWQAVLGAEPRLEAWVVRGHTDLRVARLPRSAWPIVGAAVARAPARRVGRSQTVAVPDWPFRGEGTVARHAADVHEPFR